MKSSKNPLAKIMERLAKDPVVRRLAQRFRLLWLGALLAKVIYSRNTPSEKLPIYFLGEELPSLEDWTRRLSQVRAGDFSTEKADLIKSGAFDSIDSPAPLASVICSIYKPGNHLVPFISNLVEQSVFPQVEVIIVLVQPTPLEERLLRVFSNDYPNIKLIVENDLISIYAAWNKAIANADSEFLTNMNVDDIRHSQSLEIQISDLANNPDLDVVYQDVYYAYSAIESWAEIERIGIRSHLPEVTLSVLAQGINAPHNAPMWRKRLHETVGLFDEDFKSAGDHDFWIRCAINSAVFKKSEFCHVGYFINPEGMSTKRHSPGTKEGLMILRKYAKYA